MNYPVLYQWTEEIAIQIPSLNSWQVANIALFSQGVMKAASSRQQEIARQVVCGERVGSAARRLRRFISNKNLKMGSFFEEWSGWVTGAMPAGRLYLLIDETKLNDRLGVMVVGVAWENRCIPLAWRCYKANSAADYPAEGQVELIKSLLACIQRGLSPEQSVVVLADRGIGTSPALCRAVDNLGWHYLFRVTCQSKICTETGDYAIASMVKEGHVWLASGKIFKNRGRLPAHARAIWSQGYDEPWALVTNNETLTGFEYGQRNWQEQSFRDLKSHGWQWEQSETSIPFLMERLMILLVLAYAWALVLGGYAVQQDRPQPLQRHADGQYRRHWSLFKEGLCFFFEVILRTGQFPTFYFITDQRFT